jgi:hypothetical protein
MAGMRGRGRAGSCRRGMAGMRGRGTAGKCRRGIAGMRKRGNAGADSRGIAGRGTRALAASTAAPSAGTRRRGRERLGFRRGDPLEERGGPALTTAVAGVARASGEDARGALPDEPAVRRSTAGRPRAGERLGRSPDAEARASMNSRGVKERRSGSVDIARLTTAWAAAGRALRSPLRAVCVARNTAPREYTLLRMSIGRSARSSGERYA